MSTESKKLAENSLDDGNESLPIVGTLAIFITAVIIIVVLGLMSGNLNVSVHQIGKTPITGEAFTDAIATGMVAPIDTTPEEALSALLEPAPVYILAGLTGAEKHLCELDMAETAQERIEQYSICKLVSSMELDGDDYESITTLMQRFPSVNAVAVNKMTKTGKLTYIDMRELKLLINEIQVKEAKAELLGQAQKAKPELLK